MSEAARLAFEQDAKTRNGGAYADVNLSATRTPTGYVNPTWHADWLLWERAWNEALATAGVQASVKPGDCVHCGKEICNDLGWCNSFKAAPAGVGGLDRG